MTNNPERVAAIVSAHCGAVRDETLSGFCSSWQISRGSLESIRSNPGLIDSTPLAFFKFAASAFITQTPSPSPSPNCFSSNTASGKRRAAGCAGGTARALPVVFIRQPNGWHLILPLILLLIHLPDAVGRKNRSKNKITNKRRVPSVCLPVVTTTGSRPETPTPRRGGGLQAARFSNANA